MENDSHPESVLRAVKIQAFMLEAMPFAYIVILYFFSANAAIPQGEPLSTWNLLLVAFIIIGILSQVINVGYFIPKFKQKYDQSPSLFVLIYMLGAAEIGVYGLILGMLSIISVGEIPYITVGICIGWNILIGAFLIYKYLLPATRFFKTGQKEW